MICPKCKNKLKQSPRIPWHYSCNCGYEIRYELDGLVVIEPCKGVNGLFHRPCEEIINDFLKY